ncbi:MAG: hypothetical protein GX552_03325 [Chloroflexi bacterium]|nr:hypothetical protein [Chloroflexota bacterium]
MIDAQNNAPLTNAEILVGQERLLTGQDGRYEARLEIGVHRVEVSAPGYIPEIFTTTITEDTRDYTNDVKLTRQMLRGVVYDQATESALAGARVQHGDAEATTDEQGLFELPAVEGQPANISAPGYVPAEIPAAQAQAAFTPAEEPLTINLTPRVLSGSVTDAQSGEPVADVVVAAGNATAKTDAQGHYELVHVDPGTAVTFTHDAYKPSPELAYDGQEQADVTLEPFQVTVTILDVANDAPLEGATVSNGEQTAQANAEGQATLRAVPPAKLTVAREGYRSQELDYQGEETLEAKLEASQLIGIVRNGETQETVPGALVQVFTGDNPTPMLINADDQGKFVVEDALDVTKVAVKKPGYLLASAPVNGPGSVTVDLEPFTARAIYIPFGLLSLPDYIEELLDLVADSDLNAVVVDVKGDSARIAWDSPNQLAKDADAYFPGLMDLQEFIEKCRERDIYIIARIVVFKDDTLAAAHPELAVTTKDGQIYKDYSEQRWLDAYIQEARDYNVDLALEVAQMGFDEIQFDYIRFPTEGKLNWRVYAQEDTEENRSRAINEFLAQASAALKPTPVFLSADIFGLNVWVKMPGDNNVGQRLEELAENLDYISPMVYPSTFWTGNLGFSNPSLYPYEVVYRSMLVAQERTDCLIRPWLQHYSSPGVTYGPLEFMKERKGAEDANSAGWIFWNSRGRYQTEVFYTEKMQEYADVLARSIAQEEAAWNAD